MITAIAVISLIGFVWNIFKQIFPFTASQEKDYPEFCAFISAIMVISWWTVSFPTAITLLCVAAIWNGFMLWATFD